MANQVTFSNAQIQQLQNLIDSLQGIDNSPPGKYVPAYALVNQGIQANPSENQWRTNGVRLGILHKDVGRDRGQNSPSFANVLPGRRRHD